MLAQATTESISNQDSFMQMNTEEGGGGTTKVTKAGGGGRNRYILEECKQFEWGEPSQEK